MMISACSGPLPQSHIPLSCCLHNWPVFTWDLISWSLFWGLFLGSFSGFLGNCARFSWKTWMNCRCSGISQFWAVCWSIWFSWPSTWSDFTNSALLTYIWSCSYWKSWIFSLPSPSCSSSACWMGFFSVETINDWAVSIPKGYSRFFLLFLFFGNGNELGIDDFLQISIEFLRFHYLF